MTRISTKGVIMILSIESSCDDSSLALTRVNDCALLWHYKVSQDSHHSQYGGVVPEIASRLHALALPNLLAKCAEFLQTHIHKSHQDSKNPFSAIKAIAVTNRPGLSITLSEGVCMANALALSLNVPIMYINHLKGHIYSLFINQNDICVGNGLAVLLVSGGHTQILEFQSYEHIKLIACSLDDSFGESFDKVAKMLSLGYPGGPIVESYATKHPQDAPLFAFSLPLLHDKRLAFSFSGLKNAVRLTIEQEKRKMARLDSKTIAKICASFQNTACEHLLNKLEKYFDKKADVFSHFAIVGGASANAFLRTKIANLCEKFEKKLLLADLEFCADNAAMIGRIACESYRRGEFSPISDTIASKSLPNDFE